MQRFSRTAAWVTLALATTSIPAIAAGSGAWHILPTASYEARTGRIPPRGFSGAMEYFGGIVFANVEVVSVMWGPNVNATTVAEIPDFSAAIANSTFIDQLSEYSTVGLTGVTGHKGSNQTIARGSYYGQVQITPRNKSLNISDTDIHRELTHQIAIGALPPQGPNMFYIPTPGTNPAFPQAWNTSNGYEIGDLCEGYTGTLTDPTTSYEVTQVYLNSRSGCSTGNYTSP